MKEENASLRSELSQIRSMCDKLLSENAALKVMLESNGLVLQFDKQLLLALNEGHNNELGC